MEKNRWQMCNESRQQNEKCLNFGKTTHQFNWTNLILHCKQTTMNLKIELGYFLAKDLPVSAFFYILCKESFLRVGITIYGIIEYQNDNKQKITYHCDNP